MLRLYDHLLRHGLANDLLRAVDRYDEQPVERARVDDLDGGAQQ